MNLAQLNLAAGAIGAIAHTVFAIGLVRTDREPKPAGSYAAEGTLSVLATLPAAIAFDFFEWKFDCRNNAQMATAIAICACLTAVVVFGVMRFTGYLWTLQPVLAR